MLKFKGTKKDYRVFMDSLMSRYGASATLKEVCAKEVNKNVSM